MIPAHSPSLSQEDEQIYFYHWISCHQAPSLSNPPCLERDRAEVLDHAQCIQTLQSFPSTPEVERRLAVAKKRHEWASWRLFPFNSLPDDIILLIFHQGTFCSPENELSPRMPFLYSRVCKKWRDLAYRASWLWSYIAFDEDPPYNLTRHFLALSRFAPLIIEINISNLKFDFADDQLWPEEDHLHGLLSILLPHAYRWRSFLCITDNWAPMAGVLKHLQSAQFPTLKDLELVQYFLPEDLLETRLLLPVFSTAPSSLRRLRLNGVAIDWRHLSGLNLNLAELSIQEISFEEERPSFEAFYDILGACQGNLRELTLVGSAPIGWEGDFRNLPPIPLLNLEHFNFRGSMGNGDDTNLDYLSSLLNIVQFGPKMCTLTIGQLLCGPNFDFDSILPVLSAKFSQVECLHIAFMPMSRDQIASWLRIFSNITTLYLYGDDFQADVARVLSEPVSVYGISSIPALCPALKILSPWHPRTSLVYILVCERAALGVPLQTIMWDINQRKDVEDMEQLSFLKEIVEMVYQGKLRDPEDREWEGPDGDEYIDDESDAIDAVDTFVEGMETRR